MNDRFTCAIQVINKSCRIHCLAALLFIIPQECYSLQLEHVFILYLAQCDDSEGAFTNGQLYALAVLTKKLRAYVRHIQCDYGLFEIEGRRFHESIINQYSPARKDMYAGEDVDIDIEKEKKKKCVHLDGTHSELETLRAGRRVCNHCKWLNYVKPSRMRRILRELDERHPYLPTKA